MAIELLQRVILKFKDNRLECLTKQADKKFSGFLSELRSSREWKELRKQFAGITIKKLITAVGQNKLRQLRKKAIKNDPSCGGYVSNLLSYFAIICPRSIKARTLAQALSQDPKWKKRGLEMAY